MDVSRRAILYGIGSGLTRLLQERLLAAGQAFGHLSQQPETAVPRLELSLTAVSASILRIIIAANDEPLARLYSDGSLVAHSWPQPMLRMSLEASQTRHTAWGSRRIEVSTDPLRMIVKEADGRLRQELTYDHDRIGFRCGEPVFGLGEGGHPFDRRGTTDAMGNGESVPGLDTFGARVPIPWLIGASGWGLFFHEPAGRFELTNDTGTFHPHESARGLDIFLLLGDTPPQLLRAWADLTGHPHLPPLWAFGYQQSHRTLASREEVMQEAKTFREKQLPCDTLIYLGTGFCPSGWNTGHGSFTFNRQVFPDPAEMIHQLHQQHFKIVLHVVNPPVDLHGTVADTGTAASEPSDAARYWANHVPLDRIGVDGWWPDEGDPLPVAARLARNEMYWEGEQQVRPNLRPFALHRNGYAGMQRYAWLWSGDVLSTWEALAAQVMVGINVGLCGIPWWGTDTGGFVPTKEFTAELFLRWFQFSAFCPLFRGHGRTWKLRVPWGWDTGNYGPAEMSPERAAMVLPKPEDLHNPAVERICRKYLNTRYRLLPYLYSAAAETHATGIPLMRALWLQYPDDARLTGISDTYMFGPDLLVAPVLRPGSPERAVCLPPGDWWDFWTSERLAGGGIVSRRVDLETIPLYVKAGAVLPRGPIKQYVSEISHEPMTLTVYPGADGASVLYEDDGASFAYQKGDFLRTELRWNDASRRLTLKHVKGKRITRRMFRIGLPGKEMREVHYDGESLDLQL